MARIPARSLILPSSSPLRRRRRSFSSSSHRRVELIEIDLDSADSSSSSSGGGGGVRRLEEAIHSIIARRSEPDWLRFAPGRSYWVPPRSPGIADLVGKLTNPLSPEQALSLTTPRGWPARAFFIPGTIPHQVEDSTKVVAENSNDEEN